MTFSLYLKQTINLDTFIKDKGYINQKIVLAKYDYRVKMCFEMSVDHSIWFQKLFTRRFATKRPSLFLTQK